MKPEIKIILLNLEFYNNLMKIIKTYIKTFKCNKNAALILLTDKQKLETELKNKIDEIKNDIITEPQVNGNFVVSDKLKILIEENNVCNILLFLMGRTSFIRGYCSALLITIKCDCVIEKIQKTITKATDLENELFEYQQKLYNSCKC